MATVTLTSPTYACQRIALHRNDEWQNISEKALEIAHYYIPFHLRNTVQQDSLRGLPKHFLVPPNQPCELHTFIAKLCTQMEETNYSFFDGLPERVKIRNDNSKTVFFALCKEIFRDGKINWGRVVSVFTLAGCLSVYFVQKHQLNIVERIPRWVQEYVEQDLAGWIQEQGGWDDLQNKLADQAGLPTWSRALALGSVVAAAGYLFFNAGLPKV